MSCDRTRVWFPSRHKRALAAACAAASLLLLPTTSAAEPGPYPGIPYLEREAGFPPSTDRNIFAWLNAPYNGLASSVKAQQWARIPLGTLASNIMLLDCQGYEGGTGPCSTLAPELVAGITEPYVTFSAFALSAFLVSPDGAPEPYGYGQVIPVRTVAFGSIPVEIELQVSQTRDADNLPVPVSGVLSEYNATGGIEGGAVTEIVLPQAQLSGSVAIHVVGLSIDGVDVSVSPACATPPTDLVVSTKATRVPSDDPFSYNPRESASGTQGGGLAGTIDIPPFSGCTTSIGDDVSNILTATVSGPDNPVNLQYGGTYCFAEYTDEGIPKPTPPGADTPAEAGCAQYQLDPERHPDFWTIPLPWDIPDYAPGATAP